MTPENWPEPVGCGFITKAVSATSETAHVQVLGHDVYTATQVREIVRKEVESANGLMQATAEALDDTLEDSVIVLNDLLPHAGWERFDRQIVGKRASIDKARETLTAARKWLKENKDAD